MKYAIIGTGAVGGYYGGMLAKAGFDVHFLMRSDFTHVKQQGLQVDSKHGDFHLDQINVYASHQDMPPCDVIIIGLKSTENHHLESILASIVKPSSIIIVLQNGLTVEQQIATMAPTATVIGGLCFLCSYKAAPGHIQHIDFGLVRLAQYSPSGAAGITEEMKQLNQAFQQAGIASATVPDLMLARWEKLIWNIPFNGLSVILNTSTEPLMKNNSSRRLLKAIMLEVIHAAQQSGHQLTDSLADVMLQTTDNMPDYRPSMKLDAMAGRRFEIEQIYLEPIKVAKSLGVDMPLTQALAWQLAFLQDNQAAG